MSAETATEAVCMAVQAQFEFLLALCDSLPAEVRERLESEDEAISRLIFGFEEWRRWLEDIESRSDSTQKIFTQCKVCGMKLPAGWLIPLCLNCRQGNVT